jgi:hypothetical protein
VSWGPGDVIVRREVWQGRPWLANPLYVVEDTADHRRTEIGIDSLDLELDLLVSPDREVFLKDEAQVDVSAELGRFSVETARAIHATGARLKADIESGRLRWDARWATWQPPGDFRHPPELPPGWQDVPAVNRCDLALLGSVERSASGPTVAP